MSFFGTSWDDPKTAAIMGLAGGLLQGNAGAGLQQGLLGYQRQSQLNRATAAEDRQNARQDRLDAYTEEKHKAELAALKRAAMMDEMLGRQIFGDAYGAIAGKEAPTSAASTALSQGAQAGSVGPTTANVARMDSMPAPRSGGMFDGLDRQAVQADYLLNKGKNLPEWLFKRNTPDMQVTNGYAYDKNRVQPGFLPGISTSANGQTTVTMPDGRGGVRVQAPEGALDTYSAFLKAQEAAKAGYDLVDVPTSDGRVRKMPRSEAIAATSGGASMQPRSIPTMGNANITDEVRGLILADAAKNGIANPTIRMNTSVPGQTLGLAGAQIGVAPSKAEETAAIRTATANADRAAANTEKSSQFQTFKQQLGLAKQYLRDGPTESSVGALIDSGLGSIGLSTQGANLAAQLDALSGWMMQNIPKAPGAQSDAELRDYKTAAGMVGDRTKPVAQRLAALNTVETIVAQWEAKSGGGNQTEMPPSAVPARPPMRGQVVDGYKFKGGNPADPASWEKQ